MSIQVYIILCMSVFCLAVLLSFWMYRTRFMDDVYQNTKIRKIEESAGQISEVIGQMTFDVWELDEQRFEDQVSDELLESDACGTIINLNSSFQVSVSANIRSCPIAGASVLTGQTLADMAEENGGTILLYSSYGNGQLDLNRLSTERPDDRETCLLYVVRTADAAGNPVVIVLSSLLRPTESMQDTMQYQSGYLFVIVVALTVLLSYVLTRVVAQPISRINNSAKELAKGHYDTRFDEEHGYREATQLAETLNYASQELGKVDQMRNDLVANVSHDLRTPLTMIGGYAELMRDIQGENTPENAQVIIDETKHLTDMVNNILDLSKLQSGAISLEPQETDLTELAEQIVSHYRQLVQAEGFTVEFRHEGSAWVMADTAWITQVFYNLLNNAVNYSRGEDQSILVTQKVADGKVRFDVIDHGIGVSKEDLPYIWDRYYRVDKEHKRSVKGTGLGLSIVKTVLEKHGAEYGADSEPGKGSDFWFALPVIPEPQEDEKG